ncbi:MAG: hypothetical protein IIX80_00105 [Clostridia bacterium]|nr:hypothetical protein [Clostridia bacterium]
MVEFFQNPDLLKLLQSCNDAIISLAGKITLDAWIAFIIAAVLAAAVGVFGYKLIKLVIALGFGVGGYFIGEELYRLLSEKLTEIPDWAVYVCGGVVALGFCIFAFCRFSYAWFGAAAIFGYIAVGHFMPDGYVLLSVGAALLIALLSVSLIRVVFILVTSATAAGFLISFLGAIFPEQAFLQIGQGWIPYVLVGVATILFASVQFAINRQKLEE